MNILESIVGIVTIIVGIYTGYIVLKNPIHSGDDTNNINFRGVLTSLLAIIMGAFIILRASGII